MDAGWLANDLGERMQHALKRGDVADYDAASVLMEQLIDVEVDVVRAEIRALDRRRAPIRAGRGA